MTDGTFTILIVDDNANNLYTLHTLLDRVGGCEVIEASSGEDALVATLEHDINLVLLDVQMPGMDGFETAKHLQMTEKTRHIPIVFVTAVFKAEEFRQRGYQVGAVDYLTKPIDDNQLLNRIRLYQQVFFRELELKNINARLEQRVMERTAELEAKAKSLELAASVFDNASEGIVITDVEGNIVDVNEAALQITGYSREELLGKNPRMLSSGRQDAKFYAGMWTSRPAQSE